ncbi:hypothetical protein IWQ48_005477 [Labrenzia sp. EL_13]|nr:hypothetical protein [Labrenzia sp. EL_142]MBG6159018.1 hypothetical protein [Labrenzia sp. EL_162]MBG6165383.1 hypothetical protein [Labrenzia sp. EL_195]MBG6197893.1 hypothetical protein [Labrenzia sp. EL_159]MBG6204314.1 hypothetical protein [Labrenzia sp. EL_13]
MRTVLLRGDPTGRNLTRRLTDKVAGSLGA